MKNSLKYLTLLQKNYPTFEAAAAEIINCEAILNMPKGTEHFISDVHGEYQAFCHIMNNCSGVIREKVDLLYADTMTDEERSYLATIIHYPKEMIENAKKTESDMSVWYEKQIVYLVEILTRVSSKYTRSKVRKSIPQKFGYIMDELINAARDGIDGEAYSKNIYQSIMSIGRADAFIISLTDSIKTLAVDHLHIVGDIFDRGERPDLILDILEKHHRVDVQWGNHDILWIGAALGNESCITNAVFLALKFGNLEFLEDGYGISLRRLEEYARKNFDFDERFAPVAKDKLSERDYISFAKMRKAVFYMMQHAESEILGRNKCYGMDDRNLLQFINREEGSINVYGKKFFDDDFKAGYASLKAGEEEKQVLLSLKQSFMMSPKLQRHVAFLMKNGGIFKVYNGNLMFHGCIPFNNDGEYATYVYEGNPYSGKDFMAKCETVVRKAYTNFTLGKRIGRSIDYLWFLWCGRLSPLFGRERIATFERIYLPAEYHEEKKNPYYDYILKEEVCEKILNDFGCTDKHSHIVNGHIPVKQKEGENPVKSGGKLIVIDGGFCRAYQPQTGIAGYTLIYNSYGLRLSAHEPFAGVENAIQNHTDIHSNVTVFETADKRLLVAETDIGKKLKEKIADLKDLLESGLL